MAELEPEPQKKFKASSSFNREKLLQHKESIEIAIERLKGFQFCFVKLSSCNGDYSSCFSDAWCESFRNIEEDNMLPKIARFDEIFDADLLRRVLNEPVNLPDSQRAAFQRLEVFFDTIEDTNKILQKNEDITDVDLAGLFGTHILKQLAVDQQMTISDSGYSNKKPTCSCSCKAPLKYGDTSLGHPMVWHGSVDIILGSVAVHILDEMEDKEEVNSIIDMETESFELCRNQLIAETIVFSYAQRRGLVPLVAISKDYVKLYLYHPEDDLLYEGMECALFRDVQGHKKRSKTLYLSAIILLWFALNYQVLCKGVDPSHRENAYTADFRQIIQKRPEVSQIYENELRFGDCKRAQISKERFVFH